jgi:hypothetical protein
LFESRLKALGRVALSFVGRESSSILPRMTRSLCACLLAVSAGCGSPQENSTDASIGAIDAALESADASVDAAIAPQCPDYSWSNAQVAGAASELESAVALLPDQTAYMAVRLEAQSVNGPRRYQLHREEQQGWTRIASGWGERPLLAVTGSKLHLVTREYSATQGKLVHQVFEGDEMPTRYKIDGAENRASAAASPDGELSVLYALQSPQSGLRWASFETDSWNPIDVTQELPEGLPELTYTPQGLATAALSDGHTLRLAQRDSQGQWVSEAVAGLGEEFIVDFGITASSTEVAVFYRASSGTSSLRVRGGAGWVDVDLPTHEPTIEPVALDYDELGLLHGLFYSSEGQMLHGCRDEMGWKVEAVEISGQRGHGELIATREKVLASTLTAPGGEWWALIGSSM